MTEAGIREKENIWLQGPRGKERLRKIWCGVVGVGGRIQRIGQSGRNHFPEVKMRAEEEKVDRGAQPITLSSACSSCVWKNERWGAHTQDLKP